MSVRVIAYGGGVDSFAMLLNAIEREEHIDAVCFVNVGDPRGEDPGEWPETIRHVHHVAKPLCEQRGIEFVELDGDSYPVRNARSLFAWLEARQQIPVSGPNRICTVVAKVERFERWLDERFAGREVEVLVGFEAGEEKRAEKDPNAGKTRAPSPTRAARRNRFPLIERGWCRCRCVAFIRSMAQPIPPGSACVFCPYGTRGDWQRFAAEHPAHFDRVVQLEANKPPTAKRGIKLSIMDFRSVKQADGTVSHRARMLPEYIARAYRPTVRRCEVCGSAAKVRKTMGCAEALS